MAVESDARLRNFLAAPQVAAADKNAVIGKAFKGKLPPMMVRFLQKMVLNRRQMLFPLVAVAYGNLVDEVAGRVHAQVTVSREPTDADREAIAAQLSRAFAKTVVPHVSVQPEILGGIVVRVGDQVLDGSVRKRLRTLRSRVLATGR
jgi:F-type H+-transporting ATPase subunit delta